MTGTVLQRQEEGYKGRKFWLMIASWLPAGGGDSDSQRHDDDGSAWNFIKEGITAYRFVDEVVASPKIALTEH